MHPACPSFHNRMLHHTKDAADSATLHDSFTAHGRFLGDQKRRLQDIAALRQQFSTSLSQISNRLPAPDTQHATAQPLITTPDKFARNPVQR